MGSELLALWRDATFRPIAGLPARIRGQPTALALIFPAASGVVQSFLQGTSNNTGASASVPMILGIAFPVGIVWGLIQLHVVAGVLYLVARSGDDRIPYTRLRHMVALASAPTAYALVAWLLGAAFVGRAEFVSGTTLQTLGLSGTALFQLLGLYLGTVLCGLWSLVLLVLGIREVEGTTVRGALSTLAIAFVAGFGILLGLVLVAVVLIRVF